MLWTMVGAAGAWTDGWPSHNEDARGTCGANNRTCAQTVRAPPPPTQTKLAHSTTPGTASYLSQRLWMDPRSRVGPHKSNTTHREPEAPVLLVTLEYMSLSETSAEQHTRRGESTPARKAPQHPRGTGGGART
jgi:hypothetical protein